MVSIHRTPEARRRLNIFGSRDARPHADISREPLTQLALASGEEVWVVFRHIRLFPEDGQLVERDFAA